MIEEATRRNEELNSLVEEFVEDARSGQISNYTLTEEELAFTDWLTSSLEPDQFLELFRIISELE